MNRRSHISFYLAPAYIEGVEITFERKTPGASGYDLQANIGMPRTIKPGGRHVTDTGLYLAMPEGIEAQVRPRSGLIRDHGVGPLLGTIDSDYRGEIKITLFNFGDKPYQILPGDRVAQLVFAEVVIPDATHAIVCERGKMEHVSSVAELEWTERGKRGFGSTGR